MTLSIRATFFISLFFLYTALASGCSQTSDLSSAALPPGMMADLETGNPDGFLEVDCLLPGQVRKLGSMVYASPRRPVKSTANDCTIRGGEYVAYDRANYQESLAVWMVEATIGDPVAQTYVGEIYMKSPPGSPRYDLAAEWFEKAAANNHRRAQINLGYLYENGLGVQEDLKKAAMLYSQASGSNIQDIVQQYQLTEGERAEFEALKNDNALQVKELRRLKKEAQSAEASLRATQNDLTATRTSLATQQKQIAMQQAEMVTVEKQLTAQTTDDSAELRKKLEAMKVGLLKKETELKEQKLLATTLNRQVEKHKEEAQNFQSTLAALNKKMTNLPGPKIEVFDPQLLRTRGIIIAQVQKAKEERVITGKIWSPAGLASFTVNGRETELNQEGRFRSVLMMDAEEVKVRILASDQNGRSDEMQFTLRKSEFRAGEGTDGLSSDSEKARSIKFGKYYAMVIGNNEYQHLPKLKTAVEDAKTVGRLLEDNYGFEVQILYNADRNTILSTLNSYRKRLTENDNFLIYYAGHGTQVEKNTQGFWLPVDSSLDDDVNWLPTDRITGIMNLMSAKQIMIVADACYSGIMTRASLTRLDSGKSDEAYYKWLKKMAAYKSRVIISSGENKPVLDGGGGSHSIFAKALIDTLGTNTRILLGIDLHRAIAEKVVDASGRLGHDQVPQYAGLNRAGHELGDFLFVPKSHDS